MKLTEVFAKKTYRDRTVPSIEVGHMVNVDRYNNWLKSLKMEMASDEDIREYDWNQFGPDEADKNQVQKILRIASKGWDHAHFFHLKDVLIMRSRHGEWFISKKKWSKQQFMSHLRDWWSKDEIHE